ncbi:hypothetical protein MIT9_P2576 [Methylomarinovum caldicuralii]|uniref:Putative restriction endonuclease domain-containing protein n=1 Tax=Methylomarinovum caldicuralii TaxID=438856 RepID=A0AAU9CIY6_9GAMM|nr:Uma2 family endonuclease [Methylomarinovum caldicuralii]BCX82985.1 hypothetical protein MIT9_P2576 [Methylomarinovum caldicuralii]
MTQQARIPYITVEDYLEGEPRSDVRHEYVAGQVFAMVGSTLGHNRVAGNIYTRLRRHLHGTPCSVYMSDVKVRIKAADAFYYPDVVVSCEAADPSALYLTEPVLVVEVLSPSTETTDRREKRLNYQKLPTLKEYVLVAPETVQVEVYRRGQGGWEEVEIYGPEDTAVRLISLDLAIPVAEIYAGVR